MPERTVGEREKRALAKAARYLPGGSNGNTITMDVVVREGRGSHVWDLSGNEYIDYALGSGPMLLGHAHPDVVAAVEKQIGMGTTFFGLNEHAIELAEQIVEAVPCAEQVRFSSSGGEATLYAMRAARAFRGRDKILKFEGGYHGMNDYALMSMQPDDPPDFPTAKPDSPGIPAALDPGVLVAPFNDIDTTTAIIERHHDELGGVILEPLQRVIPPAPGFLLGLREVTEAFQVPLIFDEVVTGFRLAYGGAQEYYGVVPDLCALGKAISGGYPLAAIAGRAEIMEGFDPSRENPVLQEGTLNGNPIAAVAGLATLEVLRREGVYAGLFETGKRLMDGMRQVLLEAEIPAQVLGEPPVFDLAFVEGEIVDYRSMLHRDKEKVLRVNSLLLERGVYKNDSKYYVSLAHDDDDVEATLDAFTSAIEEL